MRWRPLLWLCLSVLFFAAAAYFWHLGDQWEARKKATPVNKTSSPPEERKKAPPPKAPKLTGQSPAATTKSPGEVGALNAPSAGPATNASRFAYRLSNTKKSIGELTRNDKAILLENALVDTTLLNQGNSGGQAGSK